MPWPDFTELSFGFCFLREFEQQYVARGFFPRAPDFISQYREASAGYDVEVALTNSTPVFLQFKRSKVLTRCNAKEIVEGSYSCPNIYRMCLHKKNQNQQHRALQRLESAGHNVFYVTSQIEDHRKLTSAYLRV